MWWDVAFAAGLLGLLVGQVPPPSGATANILDASGQLIATAAFREGSGEVLVTLSFPQPPVLSGAHAIHINNAGRCDPPDFASSGIIFNPFNKQHGRNNPEGTEVGDLANANLSTGLSSYNANAIGATLGAGPGSLLSPSRSIVIYSGTDDQQTAPDGNPGTPIACGVIIGSGNAAPAPILILPTAVPLAVPTQATQASSGPSLLNIGVIAVLGVALIGGGVLLRRSSAETKQQHG